MTRSNRLPDTLGVSTPQDPPHPPKPIYLAADVHPSAPPEGHDICGADCLFR